MLQEVSAHSKLVVGFSADLRESNSRACGSDLFAVSICIEMESSSDASPASAVFSSSAVPSSSAQHDKVLREQELPVLELMKQHAAEKIAYQSITRYLPPFQALTMFFKIEGVYIRASIITMKLEFCKSVLKYVI